VKEIFLSESATDLRFHYQPLFGKEVRSPHQDSLLVEGVRSIDHMREQRKPSLD